MRVIGRVVVVLTVAATSVPAQHEMHPAGHSRESRNAPALGTIVFANSGNAAAQEPFLRGIALLHSFEYEHAASAFRRAQRADPAFALAYWAEALTYSHVVWRMEDIPASRRALERLAPTVAARLAKAKTPRERAFGAAVEAFYTDGTLTQRANAYADSLRRLAAADTSDREAAAFASHALMVAGYLVDGDARTALFKEAVDLAQRVATANPNHPGATHYLIHLYDSPGMAQHGLAFARAYDKIAPDAEHALHMPSHIYLQLGMWDDVVRSNERAWAASRADSAGGPDWHAFSWLQYAYLQQGRWDAAKALIDSARALFATAKGYDVDASFVLPRLEFQYAAETGHWWTPVTRPRASSGGPVSDRERAFRQFANYWLAVDAAHRNDPGLSALAAPYLAIADSLRAGAARPPAQAANAYIVSALVAKSRGDSVGAAQSLRQAIELERRLNAFVGPPERVFAAEVLALQTFDRGRPHAETFFRSAAGMDVIRALENVLRIAPNRSQTLLLLGRARKAAGDDPGATEAFTRLRANWARADASVSAMLQ